VRRDHGRAIKKTFALLFVFEMIKKSLINGSKFVGSKILILKGVFGDVTLANMADLINILLA
jgi:hypothetical protein